jgi:flagellar assembly protein FliH
LAAIRKFTFDNDFDTPKAHAPKEAVAIEAPPPPPAFSEAELAATAEAARKAGLSEGIAQGRAEAVAQTERQTAAALGAIANHLGAIGRDVQATASGIQGTAVELSMAMVRRLFPELTRRNGLGEVEGLLTRCLETLNTEPRFSVRVATAQLEEIRPRIEEIAASRGFEGRIAVIGDDAIKIGDGQVEWTHGGMIRKADGIWAAIETAVGEALASGENTPARAE